MSNENYQKIVDAVNKGITTARIDTNPDGFGPITINSSTEGYGIITSNLAVDTVDRSIQLMTITVTIKKSDKTYTSTSNKQSLQNTGFGTKYLSDNGQYLTPPTATPTTAGYMSAEDKKRVDDIVNFGTGSNAVTTLVNIPTSKRLVKATLSFASNLSINESAMSLTDDEAIGAKYAHAEWKEFINGKLDTGNRVINDDWLWKVRQPINPVLEIYPPSVDTAALYERMDENHKGTEYDPKLYAPGMTLEQGKYYTEIEDGVRMQYYCFYGTINPVYAHLKELININVRLVTVVQ